MKCPVCDIETIVVERESIEIDYCLSCKGLWFDAGEIELLAEKLRCDIDLASLGAAPSSVSERPRDCPRCAKKMDKVELQGGRRILVDWCSRTHGIWFDSGEVGSLLKLRASPSDDSHAIVTFLGEVLSRE